MREKKNMKKMKEIERDRKSLKVIERKRTII